MSRRATVLVTAVALWMFGMEGNPRARQPQMQDCGCAGFFHGYPDESSPPSFGPIYDGTTALTWPGQCGGYCATWAGSTAAGLCGYQEGTFAVSANWGYQSPAGSGEDFFGVVYC